MCLRLTGHIAPSISPCGSWLGSLQIAVLAGSPSKRKQGFSCLLLNALLWNNSLRLSVLVISSSLKNRVLGLSSFLSLCCSEAVSNLLFYSEGLDRKLIVNWRLIHTGVFNRFFLKKETMNIYFP